MGFIRDYRVTFIILSYLSYSFIVQIRTFFLNSQHHKNKFSSSYYPTIIEISLRKNKMIKNALSFGKALKQVSFFTKPQRFSSLNSFTTLHFPTVSYAFAEDTKSAIRKEEKANFKNMSEELKKYREYRMFGPETQKVKTYLSETEKQKQLKELTTLVDKFVGSYFFTPRFDKEMFFKVLSAVSYFYDSDLIVRDEKFRKVMLDIGEKQLKQFDGRLATAFISFCALNRIDDVVIWEYFNSYVNNNLNSLQLEDKVTILKAVNPSNKDSNHTIHW